RGISCGLAEGTEQIGVEVGHGRNVVIEDRHAVRDGASCLARCTAAPLISPKEAAARFGLSHSHLRLLARTGRRRATLLGRDWFTTAAAVTACMVVTVKNVDG